MVQGRLIAGATNSTLVLNGLQATNLGTYYVEVSNGNCSESSGAAALTMATPPILKVQGRDGTTLTLSVSTEYGPSFNYIVEYKDDLNDATWTRLTTFAANGSVGSATDNLAEARCRYYRIRLQ